MVRRVTRGLVNLAGGWAHRAPYRGGGRRHRTSPRVSRQPISRMPAGTHRARGRASRSGSGAGRRPSEAACSSRRRSPQSVLISVPVACRSNANMRMLATASRTTVDDEQEDEPRSQVLMRKGGRARDLQHLATSPRTGSGTLGSVPIRAVGRPAWPPAWRRVRLPDLNRCPICLSLRRTDVERARLAA